jgi:hypothetical protein
MTYQAHQLGKEGDGGTPVCDRQLHRLVAYINSSTDVTMIDGSAKRPLLISTPTRASLVVRKR